MKNYYGLNLKDENRSTLMIKVSVLKPTQGGFLKENISMGGT